jgi:hypothetical protein
MGTTIVHSRATVSREVAETQRLSRVESYVVRNSHPISIYFQIIGSMWFVFYFWNHLWAEAILSYVASRAIGALAVSRMDVRVLAQSLWGKLGLLHLEGSNLVLQLAGLIVLLYGLWSHEARVILTGISVILLGHTQGWSRVDPRLGVR